MTSLKDRRKEDIKIDTSYTVPPALMDSKDLEIGKIQDLSKAIMNERTSVDTRFRASLNAETHEERVSRKSTN